MNIFKFHSFCSTRSTFNRVTNTRIHRRNFTITNDKLRGELSLANGNVFLKTCLGDNKEIVNFQVDSGSSYTQIDQALAAVLGFRGHPNLIGRSVIGNGQMKVDYLCQTTISVLGVEAPLVVKVAPNQPNLLGLDAMFLFDMELHFVKGEFQIGHKITPRSMFRFLDMVSMLKNLNLSHSDLVPINTLPPPEVSYKVLVDAAKTNCVIDVGTSFSCVLPLVRPSFINLGTSK